MLIIEEKDGMVKHNPNAPPAYGPERIKKEGQASFVIKNVTFKDSTIYKCLLDGETGTGDEEDSVEVIITGMLAYSASLQITVSHQTIAR